MRPGQWPFDLKEANCRCWRFPSSWRRPVLRATSDRPLTWGIPAACVMDRSIRGRSGGWPGPQVQASGAADPDPDRLSTCLAADVDRIKLVENVDLESLIEHSQDVDQIFDQVLMPSHELRKLKTHGADVPFVHAADVARFVPDAETDEVREIVRPALFREHGDARHPVPRRSRPPTGISTMTRTSLDSVDSS